MDPNEMLKLLRDAISRLRGAADGDSNDAEIAIGHEVADLAEGLDDWLSKGGFKPESWQPQPIGRNTWDITLRITHDPHSSEPPDQWNYDDMLELTDSESVTVLQATQGHGNYDHKANEDSQGYCKTCGEMHV